MPGGLTNYFYFLEFKIYFHFPALFQRIHTIIKKRDELEREQMKQHDTQQPSVISNH